MLLFMMLNLVHRPHLTDQVEYENPFTVMGQGEFLHSRADFVIGGKAVFDWVRSDEMEKVDPFTTTCNPCGPFYLSPADVSTKPESGATMAISIQTGTQDRFYFIEYRSSLPRAALITWSDVDLTAASTGVWDNSVGLDSI